jgi:hypothetical protein
MKHNLTSLSSGSAIARLKSFAQPGSNLREPREAFVHDASAGRGRQSLSWARCTGAEARVGAGRGSTVIMLFAQDWPENADCRNKSSKNEQPEYQGSRSSLELEAESLKLDWARGCFEG